MLAGRALAPRIGTGCEKEPVLDSLGTGAIAAVGQVSPTCTPLSTINGWAMVYGGAHGTL